MDLYLSSSIHKDIQKTVKLANELDFNIEISRFGEISTIDDTYEYLLELFARELEKFDKKISLHGFFFDLNVISPDRAIRELSVKRFLQSFEVAKHLGANTVVYHSGFDPTNKQVKYIDGFISSQIVFWSDFVSQFEKAGITVALENTSEPYPEVILKIVEAVDSPFFKACLDSGHVNVFSSVPIDEWISSLGPQLHHLHLHNNDGVYDQHRAFNDGTLDFVSIIKQIEGHPIKNCTLEMFKESRLIDSLKFFE